MRQLPKRKHLTRIPVWLPLDAPVTYYVTACCARRQWIFDNASTVRIALESLQLIEARLGWRVAKVCFMPDHVHLLVSPQLEREQSLSQLMQRWKTSVTLWLGREIWQLEFFDHLLRSDEKLEQKWNYIRENPVRAGLYERAEDYDYSGPPPEILRRLSVASNDDGANPERQGFAPYKA